MVGVAGTEIQNGLILQLVAIMFGRDLVLVMLVVALLAKVHFLSVAVQLGHLIQAVVA